jgi:hypothetical protein
MSLTSFLHRLGRDAGGAALVEFTITAPLLISLMCGLAEFGQGLRQYHIMQKGVRDAARYLAHVPANPPCTGLAAPAGYSWAAAVTEAKHLAVYGSTAGGSPLFGGWTDLGTVHVGDDVAPVTCLANPRPGGLALPQITVTARAPYADLGMLRFLGLGPITLTATHQQLRVF